MLFRSEKSLQEVATEMKLEEPAFVIEGVSEVVDESFDAYMEIEPVTDTPSNEASASADSTNTTAAPATMAPTNTTTAPVTTAPTNTTLAVNETAEDDTSSSRVQSLPITWTILVLLFGGMPFPC